MSVGAGGFAYCTATPQHVTRKATFTTQPTQSCLRLKINKNCLHQAPGAYATYATLQNTSLAYTTYRAVPF